MHGRRALAAAAAVGLVVSLFAPWYREAIVARGLGGLRTMTVSSSGWDAFSSTEAFLLIVAVLTLAIVLGVPAGRQHGHGPLRIGGALVALLGAAACVVLFVRLSTAPGTTRHPLEATMITVRWGVYLALACAAVVTAAGVGLVRVRQPATAAVRSARKPRSGAATPRRRIDTPPRRAENGARAKPPVPPRRRPARDQTL